VARILVIDDDEAVRESIGRMLTGAGFVVQPAAHGEEGIELARAGGFDVILSDLRMPGLSGIDVLRTLREARVDAAFIVMTGFGSIDTAVESMKLGAVDFMQKPFFRDELVMRVRAAVERRQLARGLVVDSLAFEQARGGAAGPEQDERAERERGPRLPHARFSTIRSGSTMPASASA